MEEGRIQAFKNRLQVAVDADDLKSIESILSEKISDSEIDAVGPLFAKAALRLLKYGKNIKLPENVLLNLKKYDIDTIISECLHRVGLGGLGLPGALPSESVLWLKDAVKNYPTINQSFGDIKAAIEYKCEREKEKDTVVFESLLQSYHQGRLLILNNAGWYGHGVGMALIFDQLNNKTYIALSNRGEHCLPVCMANDEAEKLLKDTMDDPYTGTIIYEAEGFLDDQLLYDFGMSHTLGASTHWDKSDFKESVQKYLSEAKPLIILPAGPQQYDTCTYVNPKRIIEAALLIFMLMKGASLNHDTTERAYHEYKQFSAYDKAQCCDMLINFYNNYREQPGAKKEAIDAIEQLMIKIILAHHGAKEDNSERVSAQKIYRVLPNAITADLVKIIPEEIASPQALAQSHHALFSRNKKNARAIRIVGRNEHIFNNKDMLGELLKILQKYSRKEIAHIKVEDNYIYIYLNDTSRLNEILAQLSAAGHKDNVANIQNEIITVNLGKKTEPVISDDAILDTLTYSGIAFDSDTDLRKDLNLTKQEADDLINSGKSGPIIRRSDHPSARNFLILSFYGPRRREVVHLQFKCNAVDGGVLIANDSELRRVYEAYKESRKPTP